MPRPPIFVAALLAILAVPLRATAQDATPAAGAFPVTPDPAECRVAPRSLEGMSALSATPGTHAPAGTWPTQVPTEADLPGGPPADPATAAAVAAAARAYVACVNRWDLARLLALATDAYVRRFVAAEGPVTPRWYEELATPQPAGPEWRATLLAVRDARVLADGRVGAILVVRHPRPGAESVTTTLFVFARAGDRWLLDDAIGVGRAGTPTP